MTPRERWLAAVKCKPVDHIPFWPKIFDGYRKTQRNPFCNMEIRDIHDWIGSDRHEEVASCVKELRRNTSVSKERKGDYSRTVYNTPLGNVEGISRYDSASDSWHPINMPVSSLEDIKIMTAWYSDCIPDIDRGQLEAAKNHVRQAGENASTFARIGTSPLMDFIENLAGVEKAHYLLADYREEVEELFEAMQRALLRKVKIMAEYNPADMLHLDEDTSTTLISPLQFKQYCFKHIQEYGTILDEADRILLLHMCGHLKDLLPDLAGINAAGIEAFSTLPIGNTTLLDGRTACPDKCLIGGTNAVLWTMDADTIIGQLEKELDALPHHRGIVITSAGVMPPAAAPETIKKVCEWVKKYKNIGKG